MDTIRKIVHLSLSAMVLLFLAACETDLSLQQKDVNCTTYKGSFDNEELHKNVLTAYSLYREDFKQENYSEALKNLKKVLDLAPCFRKTTFANGVVMYQNLIDHASKPLEQQNYINELHYMNKLKHCCFGE